MKIGNISILLIILSMIGIADASTITVDDSGGADYTEIQDAINVANTGDTIEVRSGIYRGIYVDKRLVLLGVDVGEGKPVIDGLGSYWASVQLTVDGIRIENFVTTNSQLGIRIESNNNFITGNDAQNNTICGIHIENYNNNSMNNNNIYSNRIGICMGYSNNNTLRDNNVYSNDGDGGIILYSSNDNTLDNNNVYLNNRNGIDIRLSSNNILSNNDVYSNIDAGIEINALNGESNNNKLSNNNVNSNSRGIYLLGTNDNIINDSTILNNNYEGILLQVSNNNILDSNTANLNGYSGIKIADSSNNNILTNNIAILNRVAGIYLMSNSDQRYSSNNNMLNGNTMSNNYYGILLYIANNNIITDNTALDNVWDFWSEYARDNVVTNFVIGPTISFTGWNIKLKASSSPANDPTGHKNIGKYIDVMPVYINWDYWLNINMSYTDNDVIGMDENTLRMWIYDDAWSEVSGINGVDLSNKNVYANITSSGTFAPMSAISTICGNTPTGQNIETAPAANLNVKFDAVLQCGDTTAVAYYDNQWMPLPGNYEPVLFYDIESTSTYTNYITIKVTYSDSDIPSNVDENSLRLFHYENGNWIDTTTAIDTTSNTVTGRVASLSPFAVSGITTASPTTTPTSTVSSPISGNIIRGSSIDIIGIMILSICLVIISLIRLRTKRE